MTHSPRYRDFQLNFWLLMCAVFVMRVGQFMVLPFFAIIVRQQFHASAVVTGMVVGIGPLCFALSSFNSGHLVDRFDAKSVMCGALIVATLGFIGMYVIKSITAYFILSMLLGFARSAFNAADRAYIFLTVPEHARRLAYGSNYIMINIGFAVGLLVGSLFAAAKSDALFLIIAFIYIALSLLIVALLPKVVGNIEKIGITFSNTVKTVMADKRLLMLIFSAFLLWLGYSQLDSVLPMYLVDSSSRGAILYAEIIVINALTVIALQIFFSKWLSKVAFFTQAMLGSVLFATGYLCFVFFNSVGWFMVGMAIASLGELILLPLFDVWTGNLASKERAGAYYAATNWYMLGSALGPVLGGFVYQLCGIKIVFAGCALLSILIIPCFKKAV